MDGSITRKFAVVRSEEPFWKCMRMVAELHAAIPHVSPFFRVKGRSAVPKPRHQKPETRNKKPETRKRENQKPATGFHKKTIQGV